MELSNYVTYHLHSDYSLLDSCTDYKEYIDYAVENGQTSIAFTEHGKPLGWVGKKLYCDEKGIKYIHGVEIYLTEHLEPKVRDNFHTVLLAKNYAGVLEINRITTKSCEKDHFYYNNRISFDEFLGLSDNVIKISACLASPLNKLPVSHPRYEELVKKYDYLEIQSHLLSDQITYNVHLATLSQKYHKPLIAGTDTHSLNKYKAECRSVLLDRKHKSYGNEDTLDLTYKTYQELVQAFKQQNSLHENLILEAIENTNLMANTVEPFELDKSIKYPILYGSREKDSEIFSELVEKMFQDKVSTGVIYPNQVEAFRLAINEEMRVFKTLHMDGFMLSMAELIIWCKEQGLAIGTARGSVGGSRVAYITDIIDLNPETWHTVFSRFCNEYREEIGDIDVDVCDDDRPLIFEHIKGKFEKGKTARVATYVTAAELKAIEEIGGGLEVRWGKEHEDNSKNPYSVDKIKLIKQEYKSNSEAAKKRHPELFYYFDGMLNTRLSQSVHPAGMVISPISLDDNYGFFDKDGESCLFLDMDEIHECGGAKYDFLILKNVKIIRDAYRMLGKPYPKTHEIDWDDQAVWDDMVRSPAGIFQMEGEYAHSMLRQFKPHSIFDMSLVTACIRPSGASYRNELIKHMPHKNPSPIIDELLKDNLGYLVYQCDTIKFLQEICGLTGSEADNVRRAIGRKDTDRLQKALPQILEGYCTKSNQPRNIAENEAKEFLQIIEDSADYQFGYNHSVAYCLLGYICAYLRLYHPYEFVTSYLNNVANEKDISEGTQLADDYGLRVIAPRYGVSKDSYMFDPKVKVITKGMSSIKFLNASVANELYDISQQFKTDNFMDLLLTIEEKTSLDARQLSILTKVDFFSQFGNSAELLQMIEVFNFFKQGKAVSISKAKISGSIKDIISRHATSVNKDNVELKSYRITDMSGLLCECEEAIRELHISDFDYKLKAAAQNEYLGYVDLTSGAEEDRRKLYILDMYELQDKFNGGVWKYKIKTKSIGSGKTACLDVSPNVMKKNPIKKGDVIYASKLDKDKKGYWNLFGYNVMF
ncbi:MAG: PHP domain-containing protein [Oscillospiraceae bacterium]